MHALVSIKRSVLMQGGLYIGHPNLNRRNSCFLKDVKKCLKNEELLLLKELLKFCISQ